MSRFIVLLLMCIVVAGCGKKPQPAAEPETPAVAVEPGKGAPEPAEPSERDLWLADLKSTNREKRKDAADALAAFAEKDDSTRDALIDLLRDKTTGGVGKTHPTQITSVREAAVVALLRAGPKGEAALAEKGITPLREGLSDKDAAIREHTAHVIGLLGPIAKPLSSQLIRVAADDKSEQVRGIAFDSLRNIGLDSSGIVGLASLMNRKEPADVKRRAAEIISVQPEVPPGAIPALVRALEDEDEVIRVSAGLAIETAGPAAASKAAAAELVNAVKKNFPAVFDPMLYRPDDPQFVYFFALGKQGKFAAAPALELLKHKNRLVRQFTLSTLGDIGKDALEAAPKIKDLFNDPDVALEAIVTAHRIGMDPDDLKVGLDLLERGLATTQPEYVIGAITAVGRLGKAGLKFVPQAVAQLTSSTPEIRFAAVELVGLIDPAEGAKHVEAVAKLASDPAIPIRRQVGTVLRKLGPAAAPAAEAVGTALKAEKDDMAREIYVDALLAMGPAAKPAVAGLAPLLSDATAPPPLRTKVVLALIQADPASKDTAKALVVASTDKDAWVRKTAAGAMGKLDPLPDDARNALVKMLKTDSNGGVQMAAARGLAMAGPRAAGAKADLEAASAGKIPASAFWAKVALAGVNGDVRKAAGTVRDGLKDRNGLVRVAAAEALTLVGPEAQDLPALMRILCEPTTGAGESAARAIWLIGPPAKDAVPRLIDLLSTPDTSTKVAAAEALGSIGRPAATPAIPKIRDAMRSDPAFAGSGRKTLDKLGAK
jgi:HEAT repeat protein